VSWPIRSISLGVSGSWVPVFWIGLGLAALLAVWAYRAPVPPLPRGNRILLGCLRFAALALLLLALFQPVMTVAARSSDRPLLAILLDRSTSMNLPAAAATDTTRRFTVARASLAEIVPALEREFDVRLYGFGTGLAEIGRGEGGGWPELAAEDQATALGPALGTLLAERERRPVAIVLYSDGAANAGSDPLTAAERGGVPVVVVPVSQDSTVVDAWIAECLVNRAAQLGQETLVAVTVESQLALATRATVVLRAEQNVVASAPILLPAGNGRTTCELRFRPEKLGMHRYTVSVEGVPGELTSENNRRAFALKVTEERLQVLLIADRLSWDLTFVRRALAGDRGLALTTLVRTAAGNNAFKPLGPGKLSALPNRSSELAPFDGVILLGVDPARFPAATGKAVSSYVAGGGGILVAAGPGERPLKAYEPGGMLAGLLPVRPLARPSHQELVSPHLTPAGLLHPVTSLGEVASEADRLWRELPPVEAGQPVNVPLGGEVLVEGAGVQGAVPLVVAGRTGAGRSLVVNGSIVWRWGFLLAGSGGEPKVHHRFWSEAVRWLAESNAGGQLELDADQAVFLSGRQVTVGARLTSDDLTPIDDATVRIHIAPVAGEGGERDLALASGGGPGQYAGDLGFLPPGFYQVKGEAERGQKRWTGQGEPFLVDQATVDGLNPAADPALLRRIASSSGGALATPADAQRIISDVAHRQLAIVHTREIPLWNHAGLFLAFIACASSEWFLRRRSGLA
jgi:hypothetical protein